MFNKNTLESYLNDVFSGSLVCASGTITIKGTADNTLDSNENKAVQKNDSTTKMLTFTNPSTGATSNIPVTIKIASANQTDVIAS